MTTIEERYKEFVGSCGDAGDKIIAYAILGSTLNMLREGAEELNDDEILTAFDHLHQILEDKSNALMRTEIEE